MLLALVVLFLIIASASAADASGDLAVIGEDDAEEPDIQDLYVEEDFNITSDNIAKYFPNGVLASNYSDSSLNFKGTFENLGVLRIAQKNVTFNGEESLFINTVFDVSGSDILLSNLTFLLNESYDDVEGSAILIRADNVVVDNVFINYTAPDDSEAYGIYSAGTSKNPNDMLTIANSTIVFTGQNFNRDVYTHALRLDYSTNALIYNNRIDS